ncbi:MAG: lysophospholipid acyltransferase family protein [bacterium]
MELKKIKQNTLRFIGNLFLYNSINMLCKTLTLSCKMPEATKQLFANNSSSVIAFWHGTMLVPWYLHRNKNVAALVSTSKDGELLTKVLDKWGYVLQRGSSNKNGKEALEILVEKAKNNYSIAITPDGPKGPAKEFKAGAVVVAKKSGLPLILVGINNKDKYTLSSWDKFEIPKLFSKVFISYSEPIYINSTISYENTSQLITECSAKLNELQLLAEN